MGDEIIALVGGLISGLNAWFWVAMITAGGTWPQLVRGKPGTMRRGLMFEVIVFLIPGSFLAVYAGGLYLLNLFIGALLGYVHLLVVAYSLAVIAAVVYGLIALWALSLAYMHRTEWPKQLWGGWRYGIYAGIVASGNVATMMLLRIPEIQKLQQQKIPIDFWAELAPAVIWLALMFPGIHLLCLDRRRATSKSKR